MKTKRFHQTCRLLCVALALITAPLPASQHVNATDGDQSPKHIWLYPIIRGEKIGLIDVEGRQVIDPVYDTLGSYSIENFPKFPRIPDIIWQWRDWEPLEIENTEQLIISSANDRWGFLNSDGSMAIKQTFERVRNFTAVS